MPGLKCCFFSDTKGIVDIVGCAVLILESLAMSYT